MTESFTVTITLIEDRGISKTLHYNVIGNNNVEGRVTISETHPWYDKEVSDKLILCD